MASSRAQVEVSWHASVQAMDHIRPRLYLAHRARKETKSSGGPMGLGKLLTLGKQAGQLLAGHMPSGHSPLRGDHMSALRIRVAQPGLEAITSTWLVSSVWELADANASLDIVSSTAICLDLCGDPSAIKRGVFTPVCLPNTEDLALGGQHFLASGQFHWMRSRSQGGRMKMYQQVGGKGGHLFVPIYLHPCSPSPIPSGCQ